MINVTKEAADKLKGALAHQEKEGLYIRIFVSGMGWGGPNLGLALEESVKEDEDQVEEAQGVPFVLEKKVVPHVSDKVIDYITSPQEGFVIRKEGADSGCGDCSC